jgi:hypothetical protein
MDKAGAAAKAVADAKEAKYREQQAAELKERLELGVGTGQSAALSASTCS